MDLLASWRADLTASESGEGEVPSWLEAAYADPCAFWQQAAVALMSAAPGASRSAVFEWYTLFHEFGERHASGTRAAIVDYSEGTGFIAQSYEQLSSRAKGLAQEWRKRGVVPGSVVGIALRPSPSYVSALLAAWHCGAVVSIVPPDGPAFVRRCFAALKELGPVVAAPPSKPAADAPGVFVVAGSLSRSWLGSSWLGAELPWQGELPRSLTPVPPPHRYLASEIAARFFSELDAQWSVPVDLSAEQLYLSALRDGVLWYGLGAGTSVAAPGFCELQYVPALLMATLACGARWVELSLEELGDGQVLSQGQVDLLGVGAKVRDLLVAPGRATKAKAVAKGVARRWFRNLAEDLDAQAWMRFETSMAAAGSVGTNLFANSAAGGSILVSRWSLAPFRAKALRSPGLPCELAEPNGTGMPVLADVGMISLIAKLKGTQGVQHGLAQAAVGCCVISQTPEGDLWVTNLGSHRGGRWLYQEQIEALLKEAFPGVVRAAVLASLPLRASGGGNRVVLLVYTTPDAGLDPAAVLACIESEEGNVRTPDYVELFELNPKPSDAKQPEKVDRAGCVGQYLSGSLWGKARAPVFKQLARVCLELEQLRAAALAQKEGG